MVRGVLSCGRLREEARRVGLMRVSDGWPSGRSQHQDQHAVVGRFRDRSGHPEARFPRRLHVSDIAPLDRGHRALRADFLKRLALLDHEIGRLAGRLSADQARWTPALKADTQSRTVCTPTRPIRAA